MDADPNEPNDIAAEMNRLVDELRRHQTEVAMQNEELRTTIADLEAAKARLAALYDDAPVGYCTLDEQRIVIEANLSLARMLGVSRDQLLGKPFEHFVRAEDQDEWYLYRQTPADRGPRSCELRLDAPSDEPLWVLVASTDEGAGDGVAGGSPRMRVTLSDISARVAADAERDRMREQVEQAGRTESLGRLTGGIAHDFNNMLGVIIGNTELALGSVDTTAKLHARLEAIHEAALRSAMLTTRLLAFARRQPISPERLDLAAVVSDATSLLRQLIRSGVDLRFDQGPDATTVVIDRSQLDQVLMNLCINASESIGNSGSITIETGLEELDDVVAPFHRVRPGSYVTLTVGDTGSGMTTETLAHVFEPFYTTKPSGAGGLGLATVHGTAAQNGGFMTVSSVLGEGSRFTLHLPSADQVDEWRRGESNP